MCYLVCRTPFRLLSFSNSDDNLLRNIELFDKLSLRFNGRILFIKDVIGSQEICCWTFYGNGSKIGEVCCTSIVYGTDKKHTKVGAVLACLSVVRRLRRITTCVSDWAVVLWLKTADRTSPRITTWTFPFSPSSSFCEEICQPFPLSHMLIPCRQLRPRTSPVTWIYHTEKVLFSTLWEHCAHKTSLETLCFACQIKLCFDNFVSVFRQICLSHAGWVPWGAYIRGDVERVAVRKPWQRARRRVDASDKGVSWGNGWLPQRRRCRGSTRSSRATKITKKQQQTNKQNYGTLYSSHSPNQSSVFVSNLVKGRGQDEEMLIAMKLGVFEMHRSFIDLFPLSVWFTASEHSTYEERVCLAGMGRGWMCGLKTVWMILTRYFVCQSIYFPQTLLFTAPSGVIDCNEVA